MNRDASILQLMLAPGLGARSLTRLLRRLQAERGSIEELVATPANQLCLEYGLSPVSAETLAGTRSEALQLAETLASHRIALVALTDQSYPLILAQQLGRAAPPVLFVRGETAHLQRPMIAFAGARDCSEPGLSLARDLAAELGRRGANIVSGYAPGIDTAAHFGALSSGSLTTAVLASGILHFTPRADLAAFTDETNTTIVSEFFPTLPWKSHSAMQRNRTICAMARAVVIIESGESGGTFAAGKAALEIGCPLYVIDWSDPSPSAAGNQDLIRRGGTPVPDFDTAKAVLIRCLHTAPPIPATPDLFG